MEYFIFTRDKLKGIVNVYIRGFAHLNE